MTQIDVFNRYSVIVLLALLILPLIYLVNHNLFTSYVYAFDKLSVPLWAALYSFIWIIFDREIKKLNGQVTVLQNRIGH
jgi:succinate dehydrogenase hydrophobic anchor subunit